jgi:hypothetical protein
MGTLRGFTDAQDDETEGVAAQQPLQQFIHYSISPSPTSPSAIALER